MLYVTQICQHHGVVPEPKLKRLSRRKSHTSPLRPCEEVPFSAPYFDEGRERPLSHALELKWFPLLLVAFEYLTGTQKEANHNQPFSGLRGVRFIPSPLSELRSGVPGQRASSGGHAAHRSYLRHCYAGTSIAQGSGLKQFFVFLRRPGR